MRENIKGNIISKYFNNLNDFNKIEIEDSLIRIYLNEASEKIDCILQDKLHEWGIEISIETITYLFETLLEEETVVENGVVFTPEYIATFICDGIWKHITNWDKQTKIIDPGCGCGIFLVTAILYIHDKFNLPIDEIINEHIYGIDIDENNVRRCKKIISALARKKGVKITDAQIHVLQADSLKSDWCDLFALETFDYVIGNPPYVNTHDMNKETVLFLKKNFKTTRTGVYNIFYAFIEHAMKYLSDNGKLSYIVPNNFLTIKSATDLRDYMKKNNYISSILDFGDNMVFKPVRTYNCIIILDRSYNDNLQYYVLPKVENIRGELQRFSYDTMPLDRLDKNGWKLVDHNTYKNINRIESQFKPIKEFVRTGIATLRDDVYMVEKENSEYYKHFNGEKYIIDSAIVKTIYKIPDLKKCSNIQEASRSIIFPYIKTNIGYEVIAEDMMKEKYSNTYKYLQAVRSELEQRDKGKVKAATWYAYGRTQGLNKYGRKLLFPTFAEHPKFILLEDESALFCNGYAIFENDYLGLEELRAILNSKIMQYYVTNTSYSIEGGYYCYQKKYIEKFSIPWFDECEKEILRCGDSAAIDKMLVAKYEITM